MAEEEKVLFIWTPEPDVADERYNELKDAGAEVEIVKPQELIPLAVPIIIAGTMALVALAQFVYQIIQNERRPGLVMDVRGGKLDIREQRSLDHGVVLVITSQGSTQYDTRVQPFSGDAWKTLIDKALTSESASAGQ